jgi:hypothetical protein
VLLPAALCPGAAQLAKEKRKMKNEKRRRRWVEG